LTSRVEMQVENNVVGKILKVFVNEREQSDAGGQNDDALKRFVNGDGANSFG
jgi:hypothetical protein